MFQVGDYVKRIPTSFHENDGYWRRMCAMSGKDPYAAYQVVYMDEVGIRLNEFGSIRFDKSFFKSAARFEVNLDRFM